MIRALTMGLLLVAAACTGDDGHAGDAGHDDGGHEDAATDGGSGEAQELCNCLLVTCHDAFHARYGETDEEAIPACEADAESLPHAGMPVMSGNFIECRAASCEAAATDETMCAAALGGAPCM
jgi:hypothetical protein